MGTTVIIIAIVTILILVIAKSSKKTEESNYDKSDNRQIKLNVSFPDPEKANDFKFYKYVQYEPVYKLEPTYQEMIRRGMKIKPEFEKAIQTKIKNGEFKNPLDFKEYFGTKFDMIGIHFLKGTDNLLSAFNIGLCFIQNEKIADTETYDFRPPEKIVETKRFQKTLELLDYEQEWIEDISFKDVWEIFEIRDFLNHNLIVVWDEEAETLEKVLEHNRINDYNLSILKIKDIAQANNLPDLIDSLLKHFNSDLTLNDDLSLIVCDLAIELKDSGIDIESFAYSIKPISSQSKSTKISKPKTMNNDFIALDVETAIGKRWSICQIGIAIVENGELKQTITELIQPPNNEYSRHNTNIHGITSEMTADKPKFPEIWEKIYPIIENKKLVAHNAEFDINCLHQTLDYYDLDIPNFDCDCTLNLTGQSLNEACASFNVSLENHHNAGCDAEACANLYIKVLNGESPTFSNVKPKRKSNSKSKQFLDLEGHDRIQGNLLKPDLENADINSPFYNKKVVFTGVLENINRQEAAEIVKNMGADIDTSITKRTNFVITGIDPGPSKMNKIIKYNNEGCNIKILYEKDFLKMIENK
ncbi:hypothetical protein D1164_14595 [Mariniphaga sediminis]|uniref:BRCT domain-containing protein n=1 Tax=Mariniphaga sediminis TaxID=1628158 RepID=A0A399D1R7_9BACT|nr:exonuclease domain-containing protein [Mariniphaga sediminis]RIH64320.1 hypothetical protein D1164_14595 [Mariniphaga sediminis]